MALLLVGCASQSEPPEPSITTPAGAAELATELADALASGDLSTLAISGSVPEARLDYDQLTVGMGDLLPEVQVGGIEYDASANTARVQLDQRFSFPQGDWSFSTTATLHYDGAVWLVDWSPTILHPDLTRATRLYHERIPASRGPILDINGNAIVENRPVYRVGIDKTRVDEASWDASARALAALVGIDQDAYAALVAASGPLAFVLAITLREGQVPPTIDTIPGAAAYGTTLPLAPSPTFALGLLGVAGEATAEIIEASGGQVEVGDIAGLSGLQRYHDEQLRGTPGQAITIIKRSEKQLAELPLPTPTPEATPTPDGPPSPPNQLLFSVAPINGEPLKLTMDLEMQRKAEAILAGYDRLVMLVVLDRSTGGILAAAASPVTGAQPFVTVGRYPPGSTMKVVTSLALLRKGLTPDSPVNCSQTATVDGRVFQNYPGYPSAFNGSITLRTALQQSCNTAFMNASMDHLGPNDLQAAAASLGIGVDFETGFDAFYGSVPAGASAVEMTAATIGQGPVLVSPMAIAAEAASVGSGQTLIPYLVEGQRPTPNAAPLTAAETAALQDMMGAAVSPATLPLLVGLLEGGKSGTAEYTDDVPPKTHGWAVGYTGRFALAAMDFDQHNTVVPQDVIKAFLS